VVYWTKLPAAISSDISFVAAGKKRGFCRLDINMGPRAGAALDASALPVL
jgi:hypothetical protein